MCILVLIAVVVCTKLKIVNDLHEHTTNQPKLNEPTLRTSTPLELGMGPEYSSDIASDGPRKRTFDDDDYNPELQRVKKKRIYNSKRSKAVIKANNDKRSKAVIKAVNDERNKKRSKAVRKADNDKQNKKRSKAVRKADNDKQNKKRPLKSDKSGKEYDTSSPFPPTAEQLTFTGKILGNSVAALFAQQGPSPEISYAAVVAEQLRSYTTITN